MLQPQNQSKKYEHLIADIESGKLKIPIFQRDFVWTPTQTAMLLDSIIKGYPIGTFIFWKSKEELRSPKNIGNIPLPDVPAGESVTYVLDGQQRIASLYAARRGARVTKEGHELDYKAISVNLAIDPDATEVEHVTAQPLENTPYVSVHKLMTGSPSEFAKQYLEYIDKITIYRARLTSYDFSTILIEDYPIDIACEVFTRINTGGTRLTLFEIMVAKTYDQTRNFDLAHEYQMLVNNNGTGKDLEDAHYDTVPDSTVLQCIAAHLVKQVRAKDILKLPKGDVATSWPTVKDGIFNAVEYFRSHMRIPVSMLLPYHTLLVPFTYFFIRSQGRMPSVQQSKLLTQYFWWASITNRFSSAVESKMGRDIQRMEAILRGETPRYDAEGDEDVHLTLDDLKYRWFSTGDAFCKAILCLYASFQPESFPNGDLVRLDNSWLKVAFSRNYHHFFPRAYLAKRSHDDPIANSVLNITLVDEYLNKGLRDRPPSVYIRQFKNNPDLEKTMRSHLIDDMDAFGVWGDDYKRFLTRRGERVLAELEKRLHPDLG